MNAIDLARDITTTVEEFQEVLDSDYFYIVRNKEPDDQQFLHFGHSISFSYWKLRGPHDGPAKLANSQNDHQYMHGFVYLINEESVQQFERELTWESFKTGYTAEKFSAKIEKIKRQQEHFNKLFEFEA